MSRVLPLLAALAAFACATGEDVDPSHGVNAGGGSGDGSVESGSSGSAGLSGGGFPGTDGSTWPDGSAAAGGSGGGGGKSCGPEICNGLDDDCDGTPDNGVCAAGCKGKEYFFHAYTFCTTPHTLSDAGADCISQKMKPVRPNDAAENDWLRQTATGLGMGVIWLGATDWTTEGDWEWPDGTKFWTGGATGAPVGSTYTNWAPKHPTGSGSNDCLQMDAAGQWLETACNKTAMYVCEDY